MSSQTTLGGFEWVGDQDPEPESEPVTVDGVDVSLTDGLTTTERQEARNGDRVTDAPVTRRVGEEQAAMDELTDANGGRR